MNNVHKDVRRKRKYEQVLAGAREVFLRDGFEGANVDDIAKEAGVSKATLYSYFPDKARLFMEMAQSECQRQADTALDMIDTQAPVRDVLEQAARYKIEIFQSRFSQRIFRICIAESDRFPELGREFYISGPELGRMRLVEYFREACGRGELQIDDLSLAADQFMELCKADHYLRLMLGVKTDFSQDDIDRVALGAVDTFMARYGA